MLEGLKTIKNYLYGKGVMSAIDSRAMSLTGIRRGSSFKIYYDKKGKSTGPKSQPQIVLEYGGKRFYPKNNIVLGSMLK